MDTMDQNGIINVITAESEMAKTGCQVWFQLQQELAEGTLTVNVYKHQTYQEEWFEIEMSRSLAFETKSFMCSHQQQVWDLVQSIMEDAALFFNTLTRKGWVNQSGEVYGFKVGDYLNLELNGNRYQYRLEKPVRSGERVALIDQNGRLVNEVEAIDVYRSLYGEMDERQLPIRRNLKTGEEEWARVVRLKVA